MDNNKNKQLDPIQAMAMGMRMLLALIQRKGITKLDTHRRLMLLMFLTCGCRAVVTMTLEREAAHKKAYELIEKVTEDVYKEFYEQNSRHKKWLLDDSAEDPTTKKKKRRVCKHNHQRAWNCIQEDYLGPDPIFIDKQFEEVYRLTKGCVERLIVACCKNEPRFFAHTGRKDATGKPGIRVENKVLGILKCVAFGNSGVAFRDYHQMARNTFSENLKAFFRAILADDDLRATYLRAPTKEDARRVCRMHHKQHKVPGMLLSGLDCLHVFWKNCPVGQQCHYKNGKNKMSSVVLEAGVDYNCWFWHTLAGHPGTNNDINIWDVSDLQLKFLSDHWNKHIDFSFEIDGEKFNRLWCLVDGIYPKASRFVKTIAVPVGAVMKRFVEWQESARKDVERAFGILVRKFQFLAHPIEYWYIDDVKNQMYGCVIMHNMMVAVRMERNERDSGSMYALNPTMEAAARAAEETSDAAKKKKKSSRSRGRQKQSEDALNKHMDEHLGLNPPAEYIDSQFAIQQERWKALYDEDEHIRLQSAVMNHVTEDFITHREKKRK